MCESSDGRSDTESLDIEFRPLAITDVDDIVRWALDDEVVFWWHETDQSAEELHAKWTARANGADSDTRIFIINADATDIGVIQTYLLSDYPEHASEVQVPDSAGVDVFIGVPEWRNRGVGSVLVRQFVDEVVFANPAVLRCTIDPEPENKRAIRAYENAGFRHVRSYQSKIEDVGVYLMVRERDGGSEG